MRQKAKLPIIFVFVILLDQISKNYVQAKWSVVCNKGIAFGIGLSGSLGILVTIAVLSLIFYLIIRERKFWSQVALSLIFAGGVSNLFDRLTLGCVRDFIQLPSLARWPSFNLADSAITFGVLLLIFSLLKKSRQ